MRIIPMHSSHLEAVLAIERQAHRRPWSAGVFTSELAQEGRRYLTAWSPADDSAGRLLGYGGIMLALTDVHITNLAVDPAVRRRGVAVALLRELLDLARADGALAATLEVRASNTAAQRLYGRFGFAPVGVRPGYYAPDGEDAVIMWAHDIDGRLGDAAASPAAEVYR